MENYRKPFIVNKDDYEENFWNHNYKITVTAQGLEFIVNANNEQDAIDYLIDYCQEHHPGLLMTHEETFEEEFIDDYICGGNEGLYLNTYNIHIELT